MNADEEKSAHVVVQLIPAEPGWRAVVVSTVIGEEREEGIHAIFPIIAWGLTRAGTVEPIYHEDDAFCGANCITYAGEDSVGGGDGAWRILRPGDPEPPLSEIQAHQMELLRFSWLNAQARERVRVVRELMSAGGRHYTDRDIRDTVVRWDSAGPRPDEMVAAAELEVRMRQWEQTHQRPTQQ